MSELTHEIEARVHCALTERDQRIKELYAEIVYWKNRVHRTEIRIRELAERLSKSAPQYPYSEPTYGDA